MNEEIKIELECLDSTKEQIKVSISNFFSYNRFPNDDDFNDMLPLMLKLSNVNAQIDILKDVLQSIIHNGIHLKINNK